MSYHNSVLQFNFTIRASKSRVNEYILKYGKYAGRSFHWLMLKDPDYVDNYRRNCDKSSFMYQEICRLKRIMDKKKYSAKCHCGAEAQKFSFHSRHPKPTFWCQTCNPAGSGIASGSLSIGSTYDDLLIAFKGKRTQIRRLRRLAIKELREAKGYIGNLTMKKAYEFFEGKGSHGDRTLIPDLLD